MAITVVGAHQATANTVAGTTGLSLTRTAGAINNLLIVMGSVGSTTAVPTISDTQTNTWNVANPDFSDATNGVRMISWWALAKNTTSTTITVKNSDATSHFWIMMLSEFTGTHLTTPLDQNNHSVAGSSGTNPTSPNITLGADNCLVWSAMVDSATAVGNIDGSAATKGADDTFNDWSEYRILVGRNGAAVNAAWTSTGAYNMFIASFKPPAATDSQEWFTRNYNPRRQLTQNIIY